MGRVKRGTKLSGAVIALALLAPPAEARTPDPCQMLRPDAVEHAIDYALERSNADEFATELDLYIDIDIGGCERQSRHRAKWKFRFTIRRPHADLLVKERGSVMITRRRATWTVDPTDQIGSGDEQP